MNSIPLTGRASRFLKRHKSSLPLFRPSAVLGALSSLLAGAPIQAQVSPQIITQTTPPWSPQYQIKAWEAAKQTAADNLGPEGYVYPNFFNAGISGGIPKIIETGTNTSTVAPSNEANSDTDYNNLWAAIQTRANNGGGVVKLKPGTFYLRRPLCIPFSNVVLRGSLNASTPVHPTGDMGNLATTIEFNYPGLFSSVGQSGFRQPAQFCGYTQSLFLD